MVREIAEALLLAQSQAQSQPAGNPIVKEALDNVMAMLAREDRGWEIYQGGNGKPEEGLTLKDLKQWSLRLREFAAGNPLGKRGFRLQHAYIEKGGGIKYSGIPGLNGEPPADNRGRAPRVKEKILDPVNQRNFFGKNARRERHLCLYTEGIRLWIGDDATKKLYPVPLDQITGIMTDPDFPGVIWAYRRAWSQRQRDGKYKDLVRWYFVDSFKDQATDTIQWGDKNEKVDRTMTAFDMHANSFDGWPFGIPDALAAWIWAGFVKDLYMDGVDVSSAMATLAFKVNAAKGAGSNAAVQFASPQGAGGTAVMGAGTDLSVLSSAGKGYDFSHIRSVIAMVATSLDVSTIALTSNTADAGSSYGSAATLDEPGRLTMMTRRDEDIALDLRVLRWMDPNNENIDAYFEPYEDGTEIYRMMQAVTLPFLQGVLPIERYQELIADVLGLPSLPPAPDGVLLPNNRASLPRKDIDSDGSPTGSSGAPTQGRSSGDGGGAPRDTRDDTIT